MANLYLHVGHSKTGTTWIQVAAALSRPALHANGIYYPPFGTDRSPNSTAVELGNASTAALTLPRFAETLDAIGPLDGLRGALLSSEELFVQLNALADPEAVAATARAAGFDAVHMLLFIRDPMEHAASLWQQYLKRGGGSAPIEPFFEKYAVPARVAEFLETFGAHERITVTVRNYSRHRAGILAPVSRWLDVDPDIWTTARAGTLNRSLTVGELAFQRALNRHLGKTGAILSDALCERLPDMPPSDLRPARALQVEAWQRLQPTMARVDAHVAEPERYRYDMRDGDADGEAPVLGAQQIEVIADAMGAEIRRLRLQLAEFGLSMAD
jgi:hypothetical protein